MKTIRNPFLWAATLICAATFYLAGCAHGPVQVKAGADPIVVTAEWTAENSLNAIDQFLLWEEQNRPAITEQSPGVVAAASALRKDGAAAKEIANLRTITRDYKVNRDAAGGERVKAASNALLAIANSVLAHMGLPPLVPPVIGPGVFDQMQNAPTNGPPANGFSDVPPPSHN